MHRATSGARYPRADVLPERRAFALAFASVSVPAHADAVKQRTDRAAWAVRSVVVAVGGHAAATGATAAFAATAGAGAAFAATAGAGAAFAATAGAAFAATAGAGAAFAATAGAAFAAAAGAAGTARATATGGTARWMGLGRLVANDVALGVNGRVVLVDGAVLSTGLRRDRRLARVGVGDHGRLARVLAVGRVRALPLVDEVAGGVRVLIGRHGCLGTGVAVVVRGLGVCVLTACAVGCGRGR